MRTKVDKWFLIIVGALLSFGLLIFSSASLGILAKDSAKFTSVAFSHLFFGVFCGLIAAYVFSRINHRIWRKHAFSFLVAALVLTMLVFVPGLGLEHGGAKRWIVIFGQSFQPAELLKIAAIIYAAAWFSGMRAKIGEFKYGLLPVLALFAVTGAVMLAQPDTDSFAVICLAVTAMFLAAGGPWKHVFAVLGLGIVCLAGLAFMRPYVLDRLTSFADPMSDPLGSSYQLRQSLIAIGSGELSGRGYGQSIQKFKFLPESVGDSIFAVAAEEFGFLGSIGILLLYLLFVVRGFHIASRAADSFGGLLVVGHEYRLDARRDTAFRAAAHVLQPRRYRNACSARSDRHCPFGLAYHAKGLKP
jgi:cell division protein FtsW